MNWRKLWLSIYGWWTNYCFKHNREKVTPPYGEDSWYYCPECDREREDLRKAKLKEISREWRGMK